MSMRIKVSRVRHGAWREWGYLMRLASYWPRSLIPMRINVSRVRHGAWREWGYLMRLASLTDTNEDKGEQGETWSMERVGLPDEIGKLLASLTDTIV